MKFHGILHLVMDIFNFGVAGGLDTGSNESHHKLTKLCAKLTQRDVSEFEKQTATRLVEFLLLDLAMAELEGKTIWEYFVLDQCRGKLKSDQIADKDEEVVTGGSQLQVEFDDEKEQIMWSFLRNNQRTSSWNNSILQFLHQLQEKAREEGLHGRMEIRSEHKRNGQIFRGPQLPEQGHVERLGHF
jgi:hypothetical protein